MQIDSVNIFTNTTPEILNNENSQTQGMLGKMNLFYLWISDKYFVTNSNKRFNGNHCLPAKEYVFQFDNVVKFDSFVGQLEKIKQLDKCCQWSKSTDRRRDKVVKPSMIKDYEAYIADIKRQQALVNQMMVTLANAGVTIDKFHHNKNYPSLKAPDYFYEEVFSAKVSVLCLDGGYFDSKFGSLGLRVL